MWMRSGTNWFGLALVAALIAGPTAAGPAPEPAPAPEPVPVRLSHVSDGDTIVVYLADGTRERVRLENIDTPERGHRAKCPAERSAAEVSRAVAIALIGDGRLTLIRRGRDYWGRLLALVQVDGADLGAALIDAGVARPWAGQQEDWCAGSGDPDAQ